MKDNPACVPGGEPQLDVDLFGEERELLEAAPFVVHYRYRCEAADCTEHEQSIVDWESGQLARRNISSGREVARAAQRRRFLEEMCSEAKDTYFFVGNQHQHPGGYLVLGLFWPPPRSRPQETLTL